VNYDHTHVNVGEAVLCTVKTERIGFQGYGMMLAEIGLPPGVDVDRSSLEGQRYEILPDRIIFYVWPHPGGSDLSFVFRPRFRMEANAAPSLLYDYYNPEARSVVRPVRFIVN
jgi:hypothetical protein